MARVSETGMPTGSSPIPGGVRVATPPTELTPDQLMRNLFGVRQFLPYFEEQSMDVAIIDAV
jgi:hypothetical protein